MSDDNQSRYKAEKQENGLWKVVYASTGDPVLVDGSPLTDLKGDQEAADVIGLLEAGELVADPSSGP